MSHSIKMDTTRPDTDSRPQGSQSPGVPHPGDKEDFEKAMGEKREGESGSEDESREQGRDGQAMPSASSLLGSLFESKMSAVAAPPPIGGNLDDLVDGLVQRILVSDPKSGAPAEILLQLNDSVLPDTQITLQRGPDGLLSVLLTTGDPSSMQTLVSAQQSLRERLEKHGPVDVRLSGAEESRQGDNDANRRSQGMVDYGPETL